jgi:hypothetical protein
MLILAPRLVKVATYDGLSNPITFLFAVCAQEVASATKSRV